MTLFFHIVRISFSLVIALIPRLRAAFEKRKPLFLSSGQLIRKSGKGLVDRLPKSNLWLCWWVVVASQHTFQNVDGLTNGQAKKFSKSVTSWSVGSKTRHLANTSFRKRGEEQKTSFSFLNKKKPFASQSPVRTRWLISRESWNDVQNRKTKHLRRGKGKGKRKENIMKRLD